MALAYQLAQGVQFAAPPDPFAQYAKMQQLQAGTTQNALAQYQLGAAKRADEVNTNFLRGIQSAGGNEDAIRQAYQSAGKAKEYQDLLKSQAETTNLGFTGQKTQSDIAAAKFKQLSDTAKIGSALLYGVNDQASYDKAKSALGTMGDVSSYPEVYDPGFVKSEVNKGLEVEKMIADATTKRGQDIVAGTAQAGQNVTMRGQDIVACTAKSGQDVTMRGQNIVAGTAKAGQQSQERIATLGRQQTLDLANRPVFNEAAQGFVGRPTAAAPGGTFTAMPAAQESKDQQAALKALKSAGYDATTGEDNISKLIAKSTSGRLGATADAVQGFFGGTNEGRKSIAALEATANQIATDLAGGKLGAGISNTDREFIVSSLGDVSNPNRPVGERLAGWNAAKQRMINVGLVPPPAPPAATPAAQSIHDQADAILRGSK